MQSGTITIDAKPVGDRVMIVYTNGKDIKCAEMLIAQAEILSMRLNKALTEAKRISWESA